MFHSPFFYLGLAFAAGIVAAKFGGGAWLANAWLANAWLANAWLGVAVAALFLGLAIRRRSPPVASAFRRTTPLTKIHRGYFFAALLALAWSAGFWREGNLLAALTVNREWVAEHAGQTAPARVKILATPEPSLQSDVAGRWSTAAEIREFNGENFANCRLKIFGAGLWDLPVGATLTARLKIFPPAIPAFPRAFNYAEFLGQENLGGGARVVGASAVAPPLATDRWATVKNTLDDWRRRGVIRLTRLLPDQRGALLAALILGWDEGLNDEVTADFRLSGLGHLLAISGLHIGLVAALAWGGAALIGGDRRRRALAVLLFILLYLTLSGGSPPAVRAGVIATVYCGGVALTRRGNFLNSLGLSTFFILGANPEQLFAVGLQFSYLAVLFIYAAPRVAETPSVAPVEAATDRTPRGLTAYLRTRFWQGLLMCVAATLGTAPLMAYYFNLASPVSLAVNLVAVPLLTVALVGATPLFLLPTPLLLAAPWLNDVCAAPVALLLKIADWSAAIPAGWFTAFAPPAWTLFLYYGVFALAVSSGQWSVVSGQLAVNSGQWSVNSGQLAVNSGKRLLFTAHCLLLTAYCPLLAVLLVGIYSVFGAGGETGRDKPARIFMLPAAQTEKVFWVDERRQLNVALLAAERNWNEILRFSAELGYREIARLIVAPDVEIDPICLRRLPAQEIIRLKKRDVLPLDAATMLTFTTVNSRVFSASLRVGENEVFFGQGLSAKHWRSVPPPDKNALVFLARSVARPLNARRFFYTLDCQTSAATNPALEKWAREKWGMVELSPDGQIRGYDGKEMRMVGANN
ncbi:MAG: ComEC/Rec2 family competence protein [Planctomycetota bacterium]|jgi:ComEC/Rec2-related protein|nr:ComEC/Rec2 family competence protein [Planctomycetota bacterium]